MNGQSRTQSFIESCVNIAVGYSIAFASQLVVFPLVGVEASIGQNLTIGAAFTAISLVRSFVIRRAFNRWHA